jgi:hypothetical protein
MNDTRLSLQKVNVYFETLVMRTHMPHEEGRAICHVCQAMLHGSRPTDASGTWEKLHIWMVATLCFNAVAGTQIEAKVNPVA